MADAPDFVSLLPVSLQAVVSLGVLIVGIIVGILGYIKKFRPDAPLPVVLPLISNIEAANDRINESLQQLVRFSAAQNDALQIIKSMMADRDRREEMDKEYQRGRDAQTEENLKKALWRLDTGASPMDEARNKANAPVKGKFSRDPMP